MVSKLLKDIDRLAVLVRPKDTISEHASLAPKF